MSASVPRNVLYIGLAFFAPQLVFDWPRFNGLGEYYGAHLRYLRNLLRNTL